MAITILYFAVIILLVSVKSVCEDKSVIDYSLLFRNDISLAIKCNSTACKMVI